MERDGLSQAISPQDILYDWFVGIYGIATFAGYLTTNPFLYK